MEKEERRMECDLLNHSDKGSAVNCEASCPVDCPKSRSRLIVTSACWRVHNKKEVGH